MRYWFILESKVYGTSMYFCCPRFLMYFSCSKKKQLPYNLYTSSQKLEQNDLVIAHSSHRDESIGQVAGSHH